jgi:hypothetical protein
VSASKYRNVPTVVDGIRFASKAEARRYADLKLLERAGEIYDLKLQVPHELRVEGHLICKYVSDFEYVTKTGGPVVEDVKGVQTPIFKFKAKLFRAIHKNEIVVVKS